MIWLAAVGLAAALPNYANSRPSDEVIETFRSGTFKRCMDRTGGVTSRMRDCYEAEGKRIDALLNTEYRLALRRLDRSRQATLRGLERRWIKNRYAHCAEAAKSEEGGTIWLLMMDDCGLSEDIRRTLWLGTVGR
jgi:uncharacterized protein YecT (DUF1311 family)